MTRMMARWSSCCECACWCSMSSGAMEPSMRFRPCESGLCRKNSCQKPSDSSESSSSPCTSCQRTGPCFFLGGTHPEQLLVEANNLWLENVGSGVLGKGRRLHRDVISGAAVYVAKSSRRVLTANVKLVSRAAGDQTPIRLIKASPHSLARAEPLPISN